VVTSSDFMTTVLARIAALATSASQQQIILILFIFIVSTVYLLRFKNMDHEDVGSQEAVDRNGGLLSTNLSWFEEDEKQNDKHYQHDTSGTSLPTIETVLDENGGDVALHEETYNRIVSERSIEVSPIGQLPRRVKRPVQVGVAKNKSFMYKKTVYLIRHAESAENHRLACLSRSLKSIARLKIPAADDVTSSLQLIDVPAQIDSDVSKAGARQIAQLSRKLSKDNFLEKHNITLIAHSPLKRARETCLGMLGHLANPEISKQKAVDQENRDPGHNMVHDKEEDNTIKKSSSRKDPRVVELDFLKERTPSEWLPYGNGKLAKRIDEFETWLNSVPESAIAIVGHSQYFKFMLSLSYKFGNCDVWKFEYDPELNMCSTNVAVTYTRRDDFGENYDGPQIEACGNNQSVNIDAAMDMIADPSSPSPPSSPRNKKEIPYNREDSLKVDLPRGWGKMENLYKYDEME